MRIALDAMGGDFAPREIVRGALLAAEDYPDHNILLVGDRAAIEPEMSEAGGGEPSNISVVHASQLVAMNEKPVEAVRSKPDSSILRAIHLLAQGEADAVIGAGKLDQMANPVTGGNLNHAKPVAMGFQAKGFAVHGNTGAKIQAAGKVTLMNFDGFRFAFQRRSRSKKWCPGEDSNLHGLAATGT